MAVDLKNVGATCSEMQMYDMFIFGRILFPRLTHFMSMIFILFANILYILYICRMENLNLFYCHNLVCLTGLNCVVKLMKIKFIISNNLK